MSRSNYTEFVMPSGSIVLTEINKESKLLSGVVEANASDKLISSTWSAAMDTVCEVLEESIEKLRGATKNTSEATVEFGISVSGRVGAVIVEGTTAATFKITLKF